MDLYHKISKKVLFYVVKLDIGSIFKVSKNFHFGHFFCRKAIFHSTRPHPYAKWTTLKGFLKIHFWLLACLLRNVQCSSLDVTFYVFKGNIFDKILVFVDKLYYFWLGDVAFHFICHSEWQLLIKCVLEFVISATSQLEGSLSRTNLCKQRWLSHSFKL